MAHEQGQTMITIMILGLDQFVVGHYSKDHSEALCDLFECGRDDLNFYAPNSMVFHDGVEQTSWNTIVIVHAPHKYEALEENVAKYLLKTLSEFSINIELSFQYFEDHHYHSHANTEYPRYIKGENIKEVDFSYEDDIEEEEHEHHHHHHDEDEPDPRDRADLDIDDPDQIYLGNAFASLDEEIAKKGK